MRVEPRGRGVQGSPIGPTTLSGRSSSGLPAAGHGCMDATSRVLREGYARFCERLGVRFPRPTRLLYDDALQGDDHVVVDLVSENEGVAPRAGRVAAPIPESSRGDLAGHHL